MSDVNSKLKVCFIATSGCLYFMTGCVALVHGLLSVPLCIERMYGCLFGRLTQRKMKISQKDYAPGMPSLKASC